MGNMYYLFFVKILGKAMGRGGRGSASQADRSSQGAAYEALSFQAG